MILCIYIYTYVTYVYVSLYVQYLCADIIPTRTHRATYLFVQVLPVSCGGVSKKRQRSADQQRDTLAKPSSLLATSDVELQDLTYDWTKVVADGIEQNERRQGGN